MIINKAETLDKTREMLDSNIDIAVVGHLEWVTFLSVDRMPQEGVISHAKKILEFPAGGAVVAAVELVRLLKKPINLYTALGKDLLGKQSLEILNKLGLKVHVCWKDKPTRKAISTVSEKGDRAITVIGERLQPAIYDDINWSELSNYKGIYVTAADEKLLQECRRSNLLTTTPRLGIKSINKSGVKIDALIGSGTDPDECNASAKLNISPNIIIETLGNNGGTIYPGGSYSAIKPKLPIIDTYGCGDCFAAAVTAGLASGLSPYESVSLGALSGSRAGTYFGPYNLNKKEI